MFFGNEQDYYFSELKKFKTSILGLYSRRARLVAERETERFKYSTNLKARWNNLVQSILDQAFETGKSGLVDMIRVTLNHIQKSIPMITVSGLRDEHWGVMKVLQGSSINRPISLLSPSSDLISVEVSGSKKFYEAYPKLNNSDWYNRHYFLRSEGLNPVVPVSLAYLTAKFEKTAYAPFLVDAEQSLNILNGTYATGNVYELVEELRTSFIKIIDLGHMIMSVQREIDAIETQITSFVADYADKFGMALEASDLLNDLYLASQGDMEAIKRLGLYEEPEQAEVVEAVPVDVAPVAEPGLSKTPWLVAGAAAIYLLTRK